jgi:hypothetical protein
MGGGMSFPKKGNLFPPGTSADKTGDQRIDPRVFATEIASALNGALGGTTAHVKIVAAWTGANERTVKNWFSGHCGPSGDHLITLIKHCDEVLSVVLLMADRHQLLAASKLDEIEKRLIELTEFLRSMRDE